MHRSLWICPNGLNDGSWHHMTTFVHVTITARVDGKSLVLLDCNGRKIRCIDAALARVASQEVQQQLAFRAAWHCSLVAKINAYEARRKRLEMSPWDRKFAMWVDSVRIRRNRSAWLRTVTVRSSTKKRCNKRFSRESRPDWSSAIQLLYLQYHGRLHEVRYRKSNPWRLWAQTVASNHRRKGHRYVKVRCGDGKAAGSQDSLTGVQMCIDWP